MIINNSIKCSSENYQHGRYSKIKYIVVHYTAAPNDSAEGEARYFAGNFTGSSAHYFVDEKSIFQSVDDSDTAWHCGADRYFHSECRNINSIGIELCCKKVSLSTRNASDNDWYFAEETLRNAAELIRELMLIYNIPLSNVLRHYDITHKICPAPFVHNESDWIIFKNSLIKGDMEMTEKGIINIDGKNYTIERILKNGQNYIRLSDLKDMGFDVGYNPKNKIPSLGIKADNIIIEVNGKEEKIKRITKFGEDYLPIKSLVSLIPTLDIDIGSDKITINY